MTLREFEEAARAAGFRVFSGSYCTDISFKGKPCASVVLRKFADGWVNTGSVDDEVARAELIALVSEFASTPLTDRYKKVIAKHENGSYVKQLTVVMMGRPALEVEMTNDIGEANDGISARERDWLDDFFGDKISYIKEY
jgi:hypothetical protein|nr:MAG TPA: hypothetical protein [Caudoviricetes sp.]